MFEFFTAIYLAALAGLAFLAFHRPAVISRIYHPLQFFISYIPLMLFTWYFGGVVALARLQPFIAPEKQKEATLVVTSLLPNIWFIIAVCLVSAVFLLFLKRLPDLSEEPDKMKKENPVKKTKIQK